MIKRKAGFIIVRGIKEIDTTLDDLNSKLNEAWKTLGDLAAQLSEFELRCEGDDYDTAAAVLLEFDFDYLFLRGHYRLMTELHERLEGKIIDPGLAQNSVGNLGSAYSRMGQVQRAISYYEQALRQARESKDRGSEGTWLGNLATCVSDLGQSARLIEYLEQALAIRREVGDRRGESSDLSRFGNFYSEIGQNTRAVEYFQQALLIDREIEDREGEALVLDNLGASYRHLGRLDEALRCHTKGLATARCASAIALLRPHRMPTWGELRVSQDNWGEAARELEQAIEIADDIGCAELSKGARESLALVNVYRTT